MFTPFFRNYSQTKFLRKVFFWGRSGWGLILKPHPRPLSQQCHWCNQGIPWSKSTLSPWSYRPSPRVIFFILEGLHLALLGHIQWHIGLLLALCLRVNAGGSRDSNPTVYLDITVKVSRISFSLSAQLHRQQTIMVLWEPTIWSQRFLRSRVCPRISVPG